MRILQAFMGLVTLGLLAVSCGSCGESDDSTAPPAIEPPRDQVGGGIPVLRIAARDNRFEPEELTAPASAPVLIEFDNQDQGVLHNLSVYQGRDASGAIFMGQLFPGSETREYTFNTPEPGSYFFRCDVHPDEMTGTLTVN
jgi:plastocyanin